MNKKFPLVSIVTVNYNQSSLTYDFLKSILGISYPNVEIFIVDNGSENSFLLDNHYDNVNVIYSKRNLGFAGGNNLALKKCNGDYILLINNDTEVDPGFLEPMISFLDENPKVGAVSPKIIYHNTNQIQYAGATTINVYTGRGRKIGQFEQDCGQYNYIKETGLLHGAALLLPAKVLREVGMMPEVYFLYYEEHDWCEKIKRLGYNLIYFGLSKIYHKESMSVGKYSKLKVYYMTRNRILFIRRNVEGFTKYLSLLFFMIFAFPKLIVKFIFTLKFDLLISACKGLKWNFINYRI